MHKLAPFLLAAILPPLAALHAADVPSGKLKAPTGPVAGAVLHLDASTLKLADGAAVTALANLGTGGAALDAAPTVTGQPPTFNASGNSAALNGLGTIHMTGTQGLQTAGNLGITGNSDRSIFVVMRHGTSGGNAMTVALGPQSNPVGVSYGICDQANGSGNLYLPYTYDHNDLIDAAPLAGAYHLYEVTRSGNLSNSYLNGALQGSKDAVIKTWDGKVQIGFRSADGVQANGDLAEVLIYNSFLDNAQRKQVEAYLAAKWFGGSLPTDQATASAADERFTDRSLAALGVTGPRHSVVSDVPAAAWEKAMVTGNGIQGAMAMGRTLDETIVLNHAGLFLPLYPPFSTVGQAKILPEVRRMFAEGKFEAAADRVFTLGKQEGKDGTTWTDPFVPACSLQVRTPQRGTPRGYLRSTDFLTGVTGTRWEDDAGLHVRRLFVSRPDNVVVMSLTGTHGVDCDLNFTLHDPNVAGAAPPPGPDAVKDAVAAAEASKDGGWLTFRVAYTRRWPGSLQGCEGTARVLATGGTTTAANGKLTVRGAKEVLVLMRTTLSRDIAQSQLPALRADLGKTNDSYDTLLARHAAVHGAIMKRCQLDLGGSEADHRLSTPALFAKSKVGALNPALLEKEFDACRYLALSSSGPEYPPNLQGIWGATWAPAWSGDYTQNGNLQTVVSGNLMANMPEAMEGFFHYLESQLPDYRDNARQLFGTRGIHVPSRSSTHGMLDQFLRECPVTFWTAGAAWNAQFFHDYWLTTGDEEFLLEHALPWMKESAAFYQDFLYAGPDGKWEFNPSFSPENNGKAPGFAMGAINSAIDTGAARELFTNLVSVCQQLGIERDNIANWQGILARMPEYKINTDGAVAEWNTPLLHDCYGHRHASHLYGLYAGLPADVAANPALQAAFKVAIEKRMQCRRANNGGDMAFGLCQLGWAATSLREAEPAYETVDWLANNFWFAESMVTSHNVRSIFNTDLAGGLPRIILTMLVQAEPGRLDLLPALPKAWPAGRVTGILCRGQIEVRELTWYPDEIMVTLRSAVARQVAVRHDGMRDMRVIGGTATVAAPQADGSRLVALPAGRDVILRLHRAAGEDYAPKVKPIVPYKAEPFGFDEVRLPDG